MTRQRYCGLCLFWAAGRGRRGRELVGECRRRAPATLAGWPAVTEADWCGEYEPGGNADLPLDDDGEWDEHARYDR